MVIEKTDKVIRVWFVFGILLGLMIGGYAGWSLAQPLFIAAEDAAERYEDELRAALREDANECRELYQAATEELDQEERKLDETKRMLQNLLKRKKEKK